MPIWLCNLQPMARAATTADAFNAIAEPRRRQILRVLRKVGAVDVRSHGRERLYRLNGRALKPIHDWVKEYEQTWSDRFELMDDVLEELKQKEERDDRDD